MRCGLLGRKLGHSYSPQIHKALGDYEYTLFEKEPEELEAFLKSGDFTGLNVTMPYKQSVIPYLDELSEVAQRLGAVNTVVCRNGRLTGHNTDCFGFRYLVQKSGLEAAGKSALVLGSGGACKTAVAVLEELGATVTVISRSGKNNYDNLDLDAELLVNTTPLGMYPNTGCAPVDLSGFTRLCGVLDVVYNPARTQLLMDAERLGIPAFGGLSMLVAQAKEAAEWFTGKSVNDCEIARIEGILRRQTENIILIGMPGCGKTTVGKGLAEALNRPFVDTDAIIEEKAGMPIPEIFASFGEAHFRRLETQAAAEVGKQSGLVIATGGGMVTRAENYPLLHQNGRIFRLHRDVHLLATDGRPLSNKLHTLYENRRNFYESFADHFVDNGGSIEKTVEDILSILEETP